VAYQLSMGRKASFKPENLARVKAEYFLPGSVNKCMLLTDDGSENYGEVKQWIKACDNPKISHVIAQAEIHFSNSMIEAANKQLKYHFLYHQKINEYSKLGEYVEKAILDFNNRPHAVLYGLTPIEVLQCKRYSKEMQNNLLCIAKQTRIFENQKMKCCFGSF
jgi:hypothetical protein